MYEIFADLLKQHGITAYRVAKDTGITTATLTDWKKGRSTPKADKLQKIAAYFGVSVDYLLGKEQEPATDSDGFRLEDDIDLTDRQNEFNALKGKEHIVQMKLVQYIRTYKKAKERMDVPRNKIICQYSTLQYFEKYIRFI